MLIPLTRAPLIGRNDYLSQLHAAWQHATQGMSFVCLVMGEPGSGKTRLLEEFATTLLAAKVRLLRGGSVEADNAPPYLPLIDAFTPLTQDPAWQTLSAQERTLLATLFPSASADIPVTPSSSPDQTRWQLYEAFTAWVRLAATQHPTALLLDDVQWADHATLGLLLHLAQRLKGVPFLVVAACRADGPTQNPELQRLSVELHRARQLLSFTLAPLTVEETGQLIAHVLGQTVPLSVAVGIHQQSEGNPFFAEELIAYWQETGVLTTTAHAITFAVPEAHRPVPPTILATVQQRVARFPTEIQTALTTAAVIGRTFDIQVLSGVLQYSAARTEQLLVGPLQARLIRHEANHQYAFIHDTVREALRALLLPLQRQNLHRAIEQQLAATTDTPSSALLANLAYHAAHSGDPKKGVRYALRAGDAALAQYAFQDAARAYALALSLLSNGDIQRGAVLMKQGEAWLYAGETVQAIERYQQAAEHFLKTASLTDYADALYRVGTAYWRVERLTDAKSAFEQALASVGDAVIPLRAMVLSDYAALLGISFHALPSGIEAASEAQRVAIVLEETALIARAKRILGVLLVRANYLDEGITLLQEALTLATADGNKQEEVECLAALTMPYFWSVRGQEGHATLLHQLHLAHQSHDPFQLRHVYSEMSIFATLSGKFADATVYLDTAEDAVRDLHNPEAEGFLAMCRGILRYFQEDLAGAEAYFVRMLEQVRSVGEIVEVWYIGWMGIVQARLGHHQTAREIAARMQTLLETLPRPSMPAAELTCHLALIAITLKDKETLLRLSPHLIPYRGQFHDALTDRLLAVAALAERNWTYAHELLDAAEQTARTGGLLLELALILTHRIEAEVGEHGQATPRAHHAATEASALYRQWGNEAALQRIAALLQPPLPSPNLGLTPREVEVLRLVAQGKSNRDIATTLFLSEKTVERHLTSIFNKTTTDNRAAASAFAVKQGLV